MQQQRSLLRQIKPSSGSTSKLDQMNRRSAGNPRLSLTTASRNDEDLASRRAELHQQAPDQFKVANAKIGNL
ncbi:hypothetical protein [Duganella lactea]|uniref:hypothetical protein n=1 Tax=Duganella lactea TaxID=2692173 RepID=UPI00136E60F0|nr:hypothetical protein [Duganella lactea]